MREWSKGFGGRCKYDDVGDEGFEGYEIGEEFI